MTAPVLALEDIVAGPVMAPWLGPINLSLHAGSITALLGANGAGKSTLIRFIAGLETPNVGALRIDGKIMPTGNPRGIAQQGIGLAPEGRRVFPGLTTLENLLAVSEEPRRKRNQRATEMFDLLPALRARQRSEAWRLSGGEQQMLAIARALMRRPRVLLLDEPSLGLAPQLTATLFATFSAIRESGVAILLAEQNIGHAIAIADHVTVLSHGRIVANGTPTDFGDPEDIATAYFS
ncbi:MAG: ABC transporter ATP-binding protein [Alphaproteobacteria bacterium]